MLLLGLGRNALERLVLSIALGRILLAIVSLTAVSTLGPGAIHAWAGLGVLAWLVLRRRAVRESSVPESAVPGLAAPLAAAAAAATVLVLAVVAMGGLPGGDGALVFRGNDSTIDPLVYASLALQVHETGLPIAYPFTSGATTTTSYLPYGVTVGLHALGTPMLDVVMRLVPLVEALALALSAVVMVRLLGGGRVAAGLGGVLVVLGGDPSFWLRPLAGVLGIEVLPLETWSFFGPYLFAFNPVTPALQLSFAAFVLMGPMRPENRQATRRAAVTIGLLVACLFETKLFVWAPVFGGLTLLALRGAPRGLAGAVRLAAGVAAFASAPFLIEKLLWARSLAGRDLTGFLACPGCLPRYLAEAALGSHDLSFRSFEAFQWRQLADPGLLVTMLGSMALMLAIAVGARAVALPELWRGAHSDDPGRAVLYRWVGLATALGLGAAMLFTTRPHYLNGLQFAWIATGSLWPFAAIPLARWHAEGRFLRLLAIAALILPGTWHALGPLGLEAPVLRRIPVEEIAFMQEVRARVPPEHVVLEPSSLVHSDFPSAVTWQAGRSVYLSLLSATRILPRDELLRRRDHLVTVFSTTDRHTALDAIAASGVQWIYAPASVPLRFQPGPDLGEALSGPTGTLYRVTP